MFDICNADNACWLWRRKLNCSVVFRLHFCLKLWTCIGTVVSGNMQQTRKSRVRFPIGSLEFFLDIIFRPHCGAGVNSASDSTTNISCGAKAAGAWCWQPYHLHVPFVMKSGSLKFLEPSGPVQTCNRDCFTFAGLTESSQNNIFSLYLLVLAGSSNNRIKFDMNTLGWISAGGVVCVWCGFHVI